nr:Cytochrome P450 [Sitophilus oryzae]
MIWLVVAAILAGLLWRIFIKPLKYWSEIGVKQTRPWIFFGDSWTTVFRRISFADFVHTIYNLHPNERYTGFYQFLTPILMVRDPELIKQITVKDFEYFTDHRTMVDPEADRLWSGNLLSLKGQKWREMRATLSGSFTSSKMKSMFVLMNEAADKFVQFFLDKKEDLIELEMKECYARFTNDVIATTAFGIKVDSLAQPENIFYKMGLKITNFTGIKMSLKFFGYFAFPGLYKKFKIALLDQNASNFFKSIINETITTREENNIIRPDMLNTMLEVKRGIKQDDIKENNEKDAGFATVQESPDMSKFKQLKTLTNEDITAQAMIFFFAGFDGASTVMCFASYELAINEYIQNKLREEIRSVDRKNDGKMTYDALLRMKYLDMVVSEVLRKWPVAVALDRVCTKPYVIKPKNPGEPTIHLAKGAAVWIPVHGIHMDPEKYPDPEKFEPERFNDENKDRINPYVYLPFGTGPRNCIGSRFALLELKALLYKTLLNFEIVPTKKTRIPLVLTKDISVRAEGGYWLGLKRINKQ